MLTDIRDYAFLAEAWRNLHVSVNKVWLFDEKNLGPDLYNSAATMDFNLNRLNFLADKNGNISSVYYG